MGAILAGYRRVSTRKKHQWQPRYCAAVLLPRCGAIAAAGLHRGCSQRPLATNFMPCSSLDRSLYQPTRQDARWARGGSKTARLDSDAGPAGLTAQAPGCVPHLVRRRAVAAVRLLRLLAFSDKADLARTICRCSDFVSILRTSRRDPCPLPAAARRVSCCPVGGRRRYSSGCRFEPFSRFFLAPCAASPVCRCVVV